MEYHELGASDVAASEISMGLWWISGGDSWGPEDEQAAIETIHTAIDAGVTYFDTAERYGRGYSEEVLGNALAERDRESVCVSTKVRESNLRPAELRASCEASLDRLGTEYVDVYHVHWPNHDVPVAETMATLRALREEGKIREIAVSNFGARDLADACETECPVANQLPYSLLWRAIEGEIREACRERGVGITAYSPLVQGLLVPLWDSPEEVPETPAMTRLFSGDRPESIHDGPGAEREAFAAIERIEEICDEVGVEMVHAALSWVLSRPGVGNVLVGARTPEEVRDCVRATEVDIGDETLARLTEATEDLKATLGPNPDMWNVESRYR